MKAVMRSKRKSVSRIVAEELLPKVEDAQEEAAKEFLEHPVTREIQAGPSSSNISGTLGGYGNLFSFLGLEAGSNPITPILDEFKKKPIISRTRQSANGKISVSISNLPSKESILEKTPLPWAEGRSWVDGVEKGVSGFGLFLYKNSDVSRSGTGIQGSKILRSGKMRNVSYISPILNNFLKKIK